MKISDSLKSITNKIGAWAKQGYENFRKDNSEISKMADMNREEQGKPARKHNGKGIGVVSDYANVVSNAFKKAIADIKSNDYKLFGMDDYVNALHERDMPAIKTASYYANYANKVLADAEKSKINEKSAADKFLESLEEDKSEEADKSFSLV